MDSNLLLLALIAAIAIIVIAAIRRRLVFEFQGSSLLLFGNPYLGLYFYSVLFFPGTVIHELSHWIVAEILQVPTGKFQLVPEISGNDNEKRLGYVMTARTGPVKSLLIGFAPLITGISILVILGIVLENLFVGNSLWWQKAIVVYGMVVVGNSMIVSSSDRKQWPVAVVLILLAGIIFYLFRIQLPESSRQFIGQVILRIDQALGLTIGLNLAMILLCFALRRGLERLTKQKVMRGR